MYEAGFVSYRAGNMSVRTKEGLLITKSGAPLGFLDESLLVAGPLDAPLPGASVELPVHQHIYRYTDAAAIIHAHPPFAVVLSLLSEAILPADTEGALPLGDVPVIIKSEVSDYLEIAGLLRERVAVLMRGHGSFTRGGSLEEAFSRTSTLEASCRILYRLSAVEK
ncbi:MAG TPA: class II aldolase/adducin family protein [Thermodesulfovibrionales bacterium]|nr:class II aldolase/adducin family protein [Thermodesulfovibrionales bacterium]